MSLALAAIYHLGPEQALRVCDEIKGQASKVIKFRALAAGPQEYGQCQAITAKGTRCSRSGKQHGFCFQHVKKNVGALEASYKIPQAHWRDIIGEVSKQFARSAERVSQDEWRNEEQEAQEDDDHHVYEQQPSSARGHPRSFDEDALRQITDALLNATQKKASQQASPFGQREPLIPQGFAGLTGGLAPVQGGLPALRVNSVSVPHTGLTTPLARPHRTVALTPPQPQQPRVSPLTPPPNRLPPLAPLNPPLPPSQGFAHSAGANGPAQPEPTDEIKRADAASDAEASEDEQGPEPQPETQVMRCGDHGGRTQQGQPCKHRVHRFGQRCATHRRQRRPQPSDP